MGEREVDLEGVEREVGLEGVGRVRDRFGGVWDCERGRFGGG